MVAEFIEDLVHLKGGEDGLDEDGTFDGIFRDSEFGFGLHEDVVPEACFEMRLHLGKVEVGPGAAAEKLFRVVKGVEAEVEEGTGHGLAVDENMALFEMPSAGADEEHGG